MNTSTITCNSTHLTSFAVLVDVSGGHNVRNHDIVLYSCGINAIATISVHTYVYMCAFICNFLIGYFRTRKKSFIYSLIYWLWNINNMLTNCYNYTSVLQVSG